MKRIEFLIWAGKQGWKHGQKYLNKAYNHFYDKGMLPDPKVLLQKAKGYYDNFTGFVPKIVKSKVTKPKLKIEKSKQIIEGMKPKAPKVVNIGDRIIKQIYKTLQKCIFQEKLKAAELVLQTE